MKTEEKRKLEEDIIYVYSNLKRAANERSLLFLKHYYGLENCEALTLEKIGQSQNPKLTRERVRQIIDNIKDQIIDSEKDYRSNNYKPYKKAKEFFNEELNKSGTIFLKFEDLIKNSYFSNFKDNAKGLIAFLNDADIRQITYRDTYYLYNEGLDRSQVVSAIQIENKKNRRQKTVEKMDTMNKTVTFTPEKVKDFLITKAKELDIPLNRLYEQILKEFLHNKPYKNGLDFEKTQSWKARNGKADWKQIGIYIDKEIFKKTKKEANKIEVSVMSYISQAFKWYSEK